MNRILLLLVGALACRSADPTSAHVPSKSPAASQPAVHLSAADPKAGEFESLANAFQWILERAPAQVIGVGEIHALADGPKVASSLAHFTSEVLPLFENTASALVVETWMSLGGCFAAPKVEQELDTQLKKPVKTVSELDELASRSRQLGILPVRLDIDCDDYKTVTSDRGDVDFEKMLRLVAKSLGETTLKALGQRPRERRTVLVYGGSLHNDVKPKDGLADLSYVPQIDAAIQDGFVEVDLFVPELVDNNEFLKDESWMSEFEQAPSDTVSVFQKGPRSFVVVVPRG